MLNSRRVVVAGGGAAGFFAAIACAQAAPDLEVILLEKGPQFLSKVRISGGGRCNVTHACFDPREFAAHYPRGEQEMIGLLQRFQARDTVAWFESRSVQLKAERDGRMFPITDSSETIIDCLLGAAKAAGVKLHQNRGLEAATKRPEGAFELKLSDGSTLTANWVLLATGGCRAPALGQMAASFGHTLEPPLPSLFTFHIETPWLRELAGVSVEPVEVAVPGTSLRERGPVLLTHWGLSGPAILRLSAWGARELHGFNYRFPLRVNWLPHLTSEALATEFESCRQKQPARLVANTPLASLSARLWERLVRASSIPAGTRWAALSRPGRHQLIQQLLRTELLVTGKSLNKDEFVTCGGVRLHEVNLKTMESRLCPGLYFAGELLDIDGLTGGFNFQAAWTTGWIAGNAVAHS
jgi:predicted Rossmann fold flavoprotein